VLFPGDYTGFVKLNGMPRAKSEFRITDWNAVLQEHINMI